MKAYAVTRLHIVALLCLLAPLVATTASARDGKPPVMEPPGEVPGKLGRPRPRRPPKEEPTQQWRELEEWIESEKDDRETQERKLQNAIEAQNQKLSSLFERAEASILREIASKQTAPTEEQFRNIIKAEIEKQVKSPDVEVTVFEGKIEFKKKYYIGGVAFSGGNIVPFSLLLASSLFGCIKEFGTLNFVECLKAAYHHFLDELAEKVAKNSKSDFDKQKQAQQH
jgi:hypothetical protein